MFSHKMRFQVSRTFLEKIYMIAPCMARYRTLKMQVPGTEEEKLSKVMFEKV
jgi:hypothetical protein